MFIMIIHIITQNDKMQTQVVKVLRNDKHHQVQGFGTTLEGNSKFIYIPQDGYIGVIHSLELTLS